jgi:hypothetical protein
VAAYDATRIDDALVRGAYKTATHREELLTGQATRERRGHFQAGHENRCWATIGMLDDPHSF